MTRSSTTGTLGTLRFGLSRHHGGLRLAVNAKQFAEALGVGLGKNIRLVMTPDYDRLLEGVNVGGVDVAWMPPLVHARAVRDGALLAAVSERGGAVAYRSALLTRADGRFRAVADLDGARAAWTDPSSASGHLFPRLHLIAAGIEPRRDFLSESFFGSPALACAAVAGGAADLCACFVSDGAGADHALALAEVRRSVGAPGDRLRVLDITASIPPDGFVLGAPLDGWTQAALCDALLAFHKTTGGAAALRALVEADRLVPVSEEVRRLIARLAAPSR